MRELASHLSASPVFESFDVPLSQSCAGSRVSVFTSLRQRSVLWPSCLDLGLTAVIDER